MGSKFMTTCCSLSWRHSFRFDLSFAAHFQVPFVPFKKYGVTQRVVKCRTLSYQVIVLIFTIEIINCDILFSQLILKHCDIRRINIKERTDFLDWQMTFKSKPASFNFRLKDCLYLWKRCWWNYLSLLNEFLSFPL